jgi:hypothetical protein
VIALLNPIFAQLFASGGIQNTSARAMIEGLLQTLDGV